MKKSINYTEAALNFAAKQGIEIAPDVLEIVKDADAKVFDADADAKVFFDALNIRQPNDNDDVQLAFEFPTFPHENYYGIASEVAATATFKSEADPLAVYISFLTSASALLGQHKYLQIGESKHYARTFAALVGASSRARKGTSFNPCTRIIRKAEAVYAEKYPMDDPPADDKSKSKGLVILSGLSSGEGLVYTIRDESEDTDKDGAALVSGIDDKRLLVVEEEFANVLSMTKRDGNTLSSTLRNAWDGKDLSPITKNNRIKATNPHINLLGHITQFELKCLKPYVSRLVLIRNYFVLTKKQEPKLSLLALIRNYFVKVTKFIDHVAVRLS